MFERGQRQDRERARDTHLKFADAHRDAWQKHEEAYGNHIVASGMVECSKWHYDRATTHEEMSQHHEKQRRINSDAAPNALTGTRTDEQKAVMRGKNQLQVIERSRSEAERSNDYAVAVINHECNKGGRRAHLYPHPGPYPQVPTQ